MKVLSSIRNAFKSRFGGLKRRGKHSSKRLIAFTVFTTAFVFAIGMICVQRISPLGDGPKEVSSPAFNIVLNDGEDGENAPVAADISSITEPAPAEPEVLADEGSVVLALKEDTGKGYLNNCVFLGDSRTVAMVKYGYVDESQTLAEVGLAHMNAEANVYTYKSGLQYTFDSFLDYYSKDIIYISYGVNGINFADEATYESSYEKLVDHVINSCPNSTIVIQSIWPVREGYAGAGNITNASIDYYNDFLRRLCDDRGLYYLDSQSVLKDEYNQMKQEYNDGDGLHYSQAGYEAVFEYLLSHPVPGYEVYQ